MAHEARETGRHFILAALALLSVTLQLKADETNGSGIPDLTKGEELTRKNPFLVGPIGADGLIWRPRGKSDDFEHVRQFVVKAVEAGSPADGLLADGDVILGADGSGAAKVPPFDEHPQYVMADAINDAEARSPSMLSLLRWRNGKTDIVSIKLETLGAYADTAPYHCEKSKKILRKCVKAFYDENAPGSGGLGMLVLLAADDPDDPNSRLYQERAREWAHDKIVHSVEEVPGGPWNISHELIALSQYYMKTKDREVFPTIQYYAQRFARGISWFGTCGHKFADSREDGSPNGRMSGYGPINASAMAGFLGMILAREAGVDVPEVHAAIKLQDTYFRRFAMRSLIPYGEHDYWYLEPNSYDMNGKHAQAAFAFALQDQRQLETQWFAAMAAAASGDRYYAHAGPYFAQVFDPLGAAMCGEQAAAHHFREIKWHLTLNRHWNGRITYRGYHAYPGWPHAATQLLTYALPLHQIYYTGRNQKKSLAFTDQEMQSIRDSQQFDASRMSVDQLVKSLSNWAIRDRTLSVRELISRMKDARVRKDVLRQLHAMAAAKGLSRHEREGVFVALSEIKDPSSMDLLVSSLTDENYFIRFVCGRGLMGYPKDAKRAHLDTFLELAVSTAQPTFPIVEKDPLQLAHGALGMLIFGRGGPLENGEIEGVDRKKLWPAVRAIAKTPQGNYRSSLAPLYSKLKPEELMEVAGSVVDSARAMPQADAMFGKHIQRVAAQTLLQNSIDCSPVLIRNLQEIGEQAKTYNNADASHFSEYSLPFIAEHLGELAYVNGLDVTKAISYLSEIRGNGSLKPMKEIHSVVVKDRKLRLPASETQLMVEAVNHAAADPEETRYTWRKVCGPGKVEFSPNADSESTKTTVNFIQPKPGNYRFEVIMEDDFGAAPVSKSVDMQVVDQKGAMPANRAPVAKAQSLAAVPGIPLPITLTGADPDGDDLGFAVSKQPSHGKITGHGAELTYQADFGYNGPDAFAFMANDGRETSKAAMVSIRVSDHDVPTVIYEGFDYKPGPINGRKGGTSFGFKGPWKVTQDSETYQIREGSITYDSLPSTGGHVVAANFHRSLFREMDPSDLKRYHLFDPGKELWFSCTFRTNEKWDYSNGRFFCGLMEGEQNASDLTVAIWGADIKLGRGERYTRGRGGDGRTKLPEDKDLMIVVHCQWGKSDNEPDIVKLHRVFDAPRVGPILLDKPVAVLEEPIDQAKLDHIFMRGGNFDEIRVGPTYQSVLMGTKPPAAR